MPKEDMSRDNDYLKFKRRVFKREAMVTVLLSGLVVASLVFCVTAFIPLKYRSDMSILVIQKQQPDNVDAYVATRSAEYLSDILSRVVYSDSFVDNLASSPYEIKPILSALPKDKEKAKKEWAKIVKTKKINNTGIIKIKVLSSSRENSVNLSEAIAWNLTQNGKIYHGGENTVEVKKIDGPIYYEKPYPNIWLNSLFGFIVGLIAGVAGCYFIRGFSKLVFRKGAKNKGLVKPANSGMIDIDSRTDEKVVQSESDSVGYDEKTIAERLASLKLQ